MFVGVIFISYFLLLLVILLDLHTLHDFHSMEAILQCVLLWFRSKMSQRVSCTES